MHLLLLCFCCLEWCSIDECELISTVFLRTQEHLKEATVVNLELPQMTPRGSVHVAPYMLVRYWLFHAFISDNNVWRGLQSDWRHFLDVMPADADDDYERRYIADPEVSMTVTRSTQLFQLLCDE